ncbi:MAG: Na/Pi cotransporter family protein [bacterium]|nr:Na/Pi cotransporter family protein [bacterium]
MEFGFLETVKLLGSLGFFIYGMKIMSEAIQKVAGSKLRDFLSNMTSNRAKGVTTGFLITSLVQSSSATTVLVVSFVNAGLLSLIEAIGVIMGANIGTTMTAWLLSYVGFKVSVTKFALPIIAFAFPMIFFSKDKIKSWGEVLIGFSLLLMGLQFLKESVPDLQSNPEILSFVSNYTDLGILSTLIFVLIGTLITVIVQSSSAAMALTLVMANQGWIPFEIAAALVLGENVGTTITANIAALVGNVHAKRAAFAHFIFNIFGVLWIIVLLKPFLLMVDSATVSIFGITSAYTDSESIKFALSAFHTSFNILNCFILVWFADHIAKLVTRIVKSKGDDDEFRLEFISTGLMSTSELSIEEARKETARYGDITARMSGFVHKLLQASKTKKQTKLLAKVRKYEEITDRIEEEISDYVQKVSSAGNLSAASAKRVASIFSIINDLERIGDLFFQLSKDIDRKIVSGLNFSDDQISNIDKMLVLLDEALTIMNENLNSRYEDVSIDSAVLKENEINEMRNKLRKEHLKNIENGAYDVRIGTLYKDIFHACEKIGDHIINVSEAITGEKEREVKSDIIAD